jgi:hypothetical protein
VTVTTDYAAAALLRAARHIDLDKIDAADARELQAAIERAHEALDPPLADRPILRTREGVLLIEAFTTIRAMVGVYSEESVGEFVEYLRDQRVFVRSESERLLIDAALGFVDAEAGPGDNPHRKEPDHG